MPLGFRNTLTAVAWKEYVIAPKVAANDNRQAVTNPIKAITASIAWVQTMVQNVLEHSAKEILYPLGNALTNYGHALRHPIDTLRQDNVILLPKALAIPFTALASSVSWAIRSALETPEDVAQWVWQTPIDAATAGTVWQLWMLWRGMHYAGKIVSTTPRIVLNYTTSLAGTGIDIVGDSLAKLTHFDAVPPTKLKYVTPSTFSIVPNGSAVAGNADTALVAANANTAVVADTALQRAA